MRWASLLLVLFSCDRPSAPTSPPVSTTTTSVEIRPRVDQPFSWEIYRGFSAFGLFAHDETTIETTIQQGAAYGWNTLRVCAETEWWDDDYYYPRVLRDLNALQLRLDFLARISGVQVLLVANCTYKHNASDADQVRWMNAVADVASDYRNVALEVVNEYQHPTYSMSREAVIEAIQYAKGRVAEVGADASICWFDRDLRHPLRRFVTFASFHPCRTRGSGPWDPLRIPQIEAIEDLSFLQKLVDANNGLAVLSEMVAYDDSGLACNDSLRTCDKDRVQSAISKCLRVQGCKPTFHSMAGLRGADYTYFPMAH